MKVLIDTNVFIRFATNDLPEEAKNCKKLFDLVEEGKTLPYMSLISVFEINYLLTKTYKFSKEKTLDFLEGIWGLRNMTVLKKVDLKKIFSIYKKGKVGLADALIISQMEKDFVLCTYDKKLLSRVTNSKTPEKITNGK
jgi:uncharacterized protein